MHENTKCQSFCLRAFVLFAKGKSTNTASAESTNARKADIVLDRNPERQKAKMNVIVLASQKGGAGKTTLAAHLAVAAEAAGDGPAVLIDTDPQGPLSAWWNCRVSETPVLAPPTMAELASRFLPPPVIPWP